MDVFGIHRYVYLTALLSLVVIAAQAQDDASSRFISKFDKDGNGTLSLDEIPEQWKGAFRRLDTNNDGALSVEEHRQRRQAAEAQAEDVENRVEKFFKARDKDGNGEINGEEIPEWIQKNLSVVDTDGNGSLTRDEYTQHQLKAIRRRAAREARNEKMKPPMPATFFDVAYGDHKKQRFDLWAADSATPAPLVIYIHGGGFRGGDKGAVNGPLIGKLLAKGIAFASMNYRLTDVGPYPMPMHDCARGLQTIRYRAKELNIDPERIGLMGGSAGSGISQWLAFHDDLADPDSADPVSRQSTRVACAAPYNAQCSYDPRFISKLFDTDQMHEALPAFYGMEPGAKIDDPRYIPLYEDASPITHLTTDDPPIFLYYSQANVPLPKNSTGKEHIHHPKFGFYLKEKMDALGIECTLRLREDSSTFPDDEVVAFFLKHLEAK